MRKNDVATATPSNLNSTSFIELKRLGTELRRENLTLANQWFTNGGRKKFPWRKCQNANVLAVQVLQSSQRSSMPQISPVAHHGVTASCAETSCLSVQEPPLVSNSLMTGKRKSKASVSLFEEGRPILELLATAFSTRTKFRCALTLHTQEQSMKREWTLCPLRQPATKRLISMLS